MATPVEDGVHLAMLYHVPRIFRNVLSSRFDDLYLHTSDPPRDVEHKF